MSTLIALTVGSREGKGVIRAELGHVCWHSVNIRTFWKRCNALLGSSMHPFTDLPQIAFGRGHVMQAASSLFMFRHEHWHSYACAIE